ncbi:hypothetical protein SO802_009669 [Lithocarpus litseifolius]|uniref:DDE Tnp4 domain-containing protein n=1 Tax=Lithocarpus litseifolius TaxID=425828 RepID=A0AAW2DC27_9ROSI
MSIQRKCKREEMEVYKDEAMRFLPLLVEFFVMLVGICSRRKYFLREQLKSEIEEGIYQRRLWMGSLAQESKCVSELRINTSILKIGKKYIKQDHAVLHEGDDRWNWFKGALGALDGTHVLLIVPIEDQGNTPTDYKELFNLRHSSARNTIEWAFGLLKKRWAILRTASFYEMKTQIRIINACCILHNFIRDEMSEDKLLRVVDLELEDVSLNENEISEENITFVRVTDEQIAFRDALAKEMFEEYQSRHRRVI